MKKIFYKNEIMNLEIDKKILEKFSGDIKVFFYSAGCEWTKVNITEDFQKEWLSFIEIDGKNVYFQKTDQEHLDWAKILPKVDNSEHSKNDKYLFISPKVQW
jgi:hypothetical protein